MAFYLIGIGLGDEKDITLHGLEAIEKSTAVYLENYTSLLQCSVKDLEKLYGKKIILADREVVERQSRILDDAMKHDASLLVIGDPLSATTHMDILQRARELNIKTEVIHNASVMTVISETGLQPYKFGKTTSIPFSDKSFHPESPYACIRENHSIGAHTLLLLDLKPLEGRFMSVNQAIEYLLKIEEDKKDKMFTKETFCIGCARLGSPMQLIKAGTAQKLLKEDFGKPLHCLIVPSKMHFMEEDFISRFKV